MYWLYLPEPRGPRILEGTARSGLGAFLRSRRERRLRTATARYPDSPEVAGLVDELCAGSAEFAELWAAGDVAAPRILRKTFQHPLVGPVTVNCDVLDIADRDQHVVIYTADPGSSSEEALRLLSVVGTQRMNVSG